MPKGKLTGLKDRHGKEIRIGDKLNYSVDGYKQTDPYIVTDLLEWIEDMYHEDPYYRWDGPGEII